MVRRGLVGLGVAFASLVLLVAPAGAHAGLRSSEPAAGASLGASPTVVRLEFSELPSAALSVVRVLGKGDVDEGVGTVVASGDRLTLHTRELPTGIYSVAWRTVSAVDGHTSSGAYVFGVGVVPGASTATPSSSASVSWVEVAGRWLFDAGLLLLLGAAAGVVFAFSGEGDGEPAAIVGAAVSAAGVVLLAIAQHHAAGAPWPRFLGTSVGHALEGRAAAVAVAGAGVALASWRRRIGVLLAGAAAAAAFAAHVAAGHAARHGVVSLAVGAQWLHIVAVGVWMGGLVALLLGVRGQPSATKALAIRRYATVAGACLLVVAGTGVVRALQEVASRHELTSTSYGTGVVAKVALLVAIAAFAAVNRFRSLRKVDTDLEPLRRTGTRELILAIAAVGTAAILAALAPPVAARPAPPAITAQAAGARLTVASAQAGPNHFTVVLDRDLAAATASLTFNASDDPDLAPTLLVLRPRGRHTYVADGDNLALDGRWHVVLDVSGQRSVAFDVDIGRPPQFVSVVRPPTGAPTYTADANGGGYIRVSPAPNKPGDNTLTVTCYDGNQDVTTIAGIAIRVDGRLASAPTRTSDGTFTASVVLRHGTNRIGVLARTTYGTRQHAYINVVIR